MKKIKLEKKGNFLFITDLNTGTVTRLLLKDTYYSFEDNNTVLVLTWDKNNSEKTWKYAVEALVDSALASFTVASLETFLSSSLASNGATGGKTFKRIATASTNAAVVKASPGNLYTIVAIGFTSTVRYLKLYNKATTPTVGTDVPVMTIPVPANIQAAGVVIPVSVGIDFSNGISMAITSGSADNDTGVVVAGDVVVNLVYA